ncbi:MAG: hypothetical protein ACO280_02350 [Pseudohongiellaceae bacterium]|jgi:hypothetical protein
MLLRLLLPLVLLSLLAACASTPPRTDDTAVQNAAVDAEREAARLREEQLARQQQEARSEAARVAEIAARATAAAAELERQEREAAAAARRPATASPSSAGSSGNPSTRSGGRPAVTTDADQQRIAELRARIAATKAEASRLEGANTALREAIVAAEALIATMTAEQEKYANLDPATGATEQPLAKSRIDELTAEVQRLRAEAEALARPAP